MKNIVVLVMKETEPDFVSRMIMRFTKAEYSHIAVCYELNGVKWLTHATGKGVHRVKLDEYLEDHTVVGTKVVPLACEFDEFLGFIRGAEGKDYAESQYFGFILPYKWVRKLFSDGKSEMICSEWVGTILEECCGYKFSVDLDFQSPKDIWGIL